MRLRLERLPFGHPSSPYHVDGEAKPPPPRLKHLELAPPGKDRATAGPAAASRQAAGSWPAGATQGQPGDDDPFLPRADEAPGPDGRADQSAPPFAAAGSGAGQAARPAGPGYGADEPKVAPDGSWRWGPVALTRDQVRIAEEAYERFRSAEGRGLFGDYDASGLTATMRRLESQLEHGHLAQDTEQSALLDADLFKARFAELIARHPDRDIERLAYRVPGALRYVVIFEPEHYAAGLWRVHDLLHAEGFQLQARRNTWSDGEDKCVSTMWLDRVRQLPFQVQFHTSASLRARRLARTSARLIGDPRLPPGEAELLRSEMAAAWAGIPVPPGNEQFDDYRRAAAGEHGGSAFPRGYPP